MYVFINAKTEKTIFIYEYMEEHFVRYQTNFKDDMNEQGHRQMSWEEFQASDFEYAGYLVRPRGS